MESVEAVGEVLDMGWMAWSIWAVLAIISAVAGWTGSGAIQRQWRQQQGDPMTAFVGLHAGDGPDLSPPSNSAEALAEVAELEALWRRSGGRRR
jgi:hypothetical protein